MALTVLCLLFFAVPACAQSTGNAVSSDIETLLRSNGLPADVSIIQVDDISASSVYNPVVVVGSGAGTIEKQLLDGLGSAYSLNDSYVVSDSARSFQGKSLDQYDLILLGGPLHNAYTSELLSKGVLKYGTTDQNKTALVLEAEKLSTGHTVLVVGTTDGWNYMYKVTQNYTNSTTQALASPTVTPRPESIGHAQDLVMINGVLVYLPTMDASGITQPIFWKIMEETYGYYVLMDAYNSWHSMSYWEELSNVPNIAPFKYEMMWDTYQKYIWELRLAGYSDAAATLASYKEEYKKQYAEEWAIQYAKIKADREKIKKYEEIADQFFQEQESGNAEE